MTKAMDIDEMDREEQRSLHTELGEVSRREDMGVESLLIVDREEGSVEVLEEA